MNKRQLLLHILLYEYLKRTCLAKKFTSNKIFCFIVLLITPIYKHPLLSLTFSYIIIFFMDLGKEKIILITVLIISYLVIEISVGWIISCNMPDRYKNKMVRIDNKNSEEELSSGTSLLPSEPLPLNMKPEKSSNIDPGIHVDSGSGIDIDIDIDVL